MNKGIRQMKKILVENVKKESNNWVHGKVGSYSFEAKVFEVGSTFGINNGKISKLQIWDEKLRYERSSIFKASIVNYDRGWDIKPKNVEEEAHLKAVLKYFK